MTLETIKKEIGQLPEPERLNLLQWLEENHHLDWEREIEREGAVGLPAPAPGSGADRLEHALLEMAEFSNKVPVLSDEAFTRESLYRDHD